jgi:putative membrane-bound dehydrogenase-like protein
MQKLLILSAGLLAASPAAAQRLEVLFLGDNGHHEPAERFPQLLKGLGPLGVNLTYTSSADDLNPETLGHYDALMVYANIDAITPPQEKALLDYVRSGHGFVPLHCASYCFRNSMQVVQMIGGQFKSHGTGTFNTSISDLNHPIMKGFKPFETWDETYVHHLGNPDRVILQKREDEPYTWVRSEGKGRVFYTAYGHDARTFANPGFHDLVFRGTLWAVGDDRAAKFSAWKPKPFEYSAEGQVPNYERRNPAPQLQLPLPVEESRKHIQVPAGYRLETIATEPLIYNVIDMKWDELGRPWIVETKDYPNVIKKQEDGSDRISFLEDTNGDGLMDKSTVFADKINIPTSMVFANGGVIVSAAPDTIFLKDTNGDGKADERKILFSGWGKGDTHAGPSNLHYGFDGWVWGCVGYSGFGGVVGGEEHRFGQGVFRFKPDGSKLEFLGPTSNNTWGFAFNENGDVFGSTANNQSSFYMPIPLTAAKGVEGFEIYDRLPGIDSNKRMWTIMDKLRQVDVFGGYTAAAGHEIYTARRFPQETWNRMALVTEPTGHVVYRAMLKQEGTHFTAENGWNLMAGADEWVAPVHASTGPDGAVWVSDWYSFIVQHNPTPSENNGGFRATNGQGNAFVSTLRDTERCRIYRIVPENSKAPEALKLSKDQPATLLAALKSDNLLWRLHGQRLIIERGQQDVVPQLLELLADQSTDAIGINGGALHALWSLHGLGAVQPTNPAVQRAVLASLKHPAQGVRRAALKVLPRDEATVAAILENQLLADKEPLVRLGALLELCSLPPSAPAGAAIYAMKADKTNMEDRWIPYGRALAATHHAEGFLAAALKDEPAADAPKETVKPVEAPKNLINNGSFESVDGKLPTGWQVRTYSGSATHEVVDGGRNGGKCILINSANGADSSFHFDLDLDQNCDYLLTGWVKTEDFKLKGGQGAMLELHMLNGRQPTSKKLKGTNDWTQVEIRFSSGRQRELSINCLYAGWGHATGKAWWDDISLVKLGPSKGGAAIAGLEDVNSLVAQNLNAFTQPDALKRVASLADAKPSALSRAIKTALTGAKAGAATAETEEELAKTHQIIRVKSTIGTLQYDVKEFSVKAGQPVAIVYENPDQLQHNLIVTTPGSYDRIGAEADKMMAAPDGLARSYIPDVPDVLAKSKLLDPAGKAIIKFTPEKPGDYPYLCTFPGHWRLMHGIIKAR